MRVNVYVSQDEEPQSFGLVAADRPISLLPASGRWRYLHDADTRELRLPEAIEEEIGHFGYWASRPGTRGGAEARRGREGPAI